MEITRSNRNRYENQNILGVAIGVNNNKEVLPTAKKHTTQRGRMRTDSDTIRQRCYDKVMSNTVSGAQLSTSEPAFSEPIRKL